MKSLVVLALLGAAAHASPILQPPKGWTGGANTDLVTTVGGEGHFGGAHGVVEAERWDAPTPGVVLYASRVSVTLSAREAAARAEIDQLHRPTETVWHEATVDKASEVTMSWKDTGVKGEVRMLLTGSGDAVLVEAKGECIAADDAAAADFDACKAALATLDPAIDVKNRVEVKPGAMPTPSASPSSGPAPATMSDGSKIPMPPIIVKQESPPADRRPIYVGAGVVLLAAAFWWNRRRRERFEREEKSDVR